MVDFLIWAAIFQGLFLAFLYLFSKEHRSFSNKILGLFLLALIQEALNLFLPEDYLGNYSLNEYFSLPESKLFLPVLFFHYVLLKIDKSKKYISFLRIMYLAGFIIVLLTFVNVIIFFINGSNIGQIIEYEQLNFIFLAQETLACALCFVVLFISIKELQTYQKKTQSEFSDIGLLRIQWLWQFILSMSLATILWGIEVIRLLYGGLGTSNIAMSAWVILFIFIYYASYKAYTHKDLFSISVEELAPISIELRVNSENIEQNPIDYGEIIHKLESMMTREQLFLDSNLSIHELARACEIPSRKISQSINALYKKNFSEWVNEYRIHKAIPLLQNISENNYTIEGIGYDCGFNSRSAMYLAFKKIKGKSPGDYKA